MKKSKLFYAFILISSMGTCVLANNGDVLTQAQKDSLDQLPQYIESYAKMGSKIDEMFDQFQSLQKKIDKIKPSKNEAPYDQGNILKNLELRVDEQSKVIDKVMDDLNKEIGKAQSELEERIFKVDSERKREKELILQEISGLRKEYDTLSRNVVQVETIRNDIDNLKAETNTFMIDAKERLNEKIPKFLKEQEEYFLNAIKEQKNSLETFIRSNRSENDKKFAQFNQKVESNTNEIVNLLNSVLRQQQRTYDEKISDLQNAQRGFSNDLDTMKNNVSNTADTGPSGSSNLLDDEISDLRAQIQTLREEKDPSVDFEEIRNLIESALAQKADVENNTVRQDIQALKETLQKNNTARVQNNWFTMNEINELRNLINRQNKRAEQEEALRRAYPYVIPQANIGTPNFFQRIFR